MNNSSAFKIRLAVDSDEVELGELLVESYTYAYQLKQPNFLIPAEREAELRNVNHRRKNSFVFVAESNDELMGTVTLRPFHSSDHLDQPPDFLELKMLALNPKNQGSGLGRAIMEHSINFSKTNGYKSIILHIRENLAGLERFYTSFGFIRQHARDMTVYGNIRLFGYELTL